jgi:hypothetical protein
MKVVCVDASRLLGGLKITEGKVYEMKPCRGELKEMSDDHDIPTLMAASRFQPVPPDGEVLAIGETL